jgi:endonuclease/exonuclease/phosphatase family metal-dependent hydrolase
VLRAKITCLFLLLLLTSMAATAEHVLVDGEIGDWQDRASVYVDAAGDDGGGAVDFGRLWMTHDADYLILRVEVGQEVGLQDEDTGVVLYLDTDADAKTGLAVSGLGAEVEVHFSHRGGRLHLGKDERLLSAREIGVHSAPTVTSTEFEIAFDRHVRLAEGPLFRSDTVRVAFAVEGGDTLPDVPGGVAYRILGNGPTAEPLPLAKQDPSHLRVLSYNTNNRLFEPHREDAYTRILAAIKPDVVLLQEVRVSTAEATLAYLEPKLPQLLPPLGKSWHRAMTGGEASVVLSPFPIDSVHPLGESGAFVLDARQRYGTPILLVCLSMPCCGNEKERRREIDLLLAFLRDAQTPGGELDLPAKTPILVIGDANLVGARSQREALLEGRIADTEHFGESFAPDWDATPFTDLVPRHTHRNVTFTWYGRGFGAGRLDYVVYSDSVIGVGNRFVLFTPGMPAEDLARYGLESGDTSVATDHLPLVADFVFSSE